MDLSTLKCICGQIYNEDQFSKHFRECIKFKDEFKEFDSKFGELLKTYSEPIERLIIVRYLLKQYIQVIERKITSRFKNNKNPQKINPPMPAPAPAPAPIPAEENNSNNFSNNKNINQGNINSQLKINQNPPIKKYSNDIPEQKSDFNQQNVNKPPIIQNPWKKESNNNIPVQNPNINQGNDNQSQVNQNNDFNQGNPIIPNPWKNGSNNNNNINISNPVQIQNQHPDFIQGNPIIQNPWQQKSNNNNQGQPDNNEDKLKKNKSNDFDDDFEPQPELKEGEENLMICQLCKTNPDILYLECAHPICNDCFEKEARNNFFEMKCKICNKEISYGIKKDVLRDKYDTIENEAVMKAAGGNFLKCPYPGCGEQIEFEPGKTDYNIKDEKGKLLSRQAAEHYASNRCRCGFCRKDFCKSCQVMPYHLGMTCEEFKRHEIAKKCRFCDTEIKGFNMGPDDDVCNAMDCRNRYTISCKKRLQCGHKCFGVNGEKMCPPCIDKECQQFKGQFGQDKDAYCPICYTEGLGSAPMVVTSCGHYLHYHCIKKRLETRWIGPKITFNHCLCPSCNKWFDINTVPELQRLIDQNKELYETIKEMSLKRLKFEDLDKDPRLTDPNSPWFGKKVEFAMKRLSYYMCFICKKPYFAGRRECGNDPNMNNDDPNQVYKPEECVCGKDANLSGVAGKTNCPKHGKDFIEYKCKFCCKIASWFCWGTTHFCEDCHKRQCNGDYVSKYTKDRLPKCNKSKCEVGGNHPPNGEEFALGCSICRNNAENDKGF